MSRPSSRCASQEPTGVPAPSTPPQPDSQEPGSIDRPTPQPPQQPPRWISIAPAQSPVSIFTGRPHEAQSPTQPPPPGQSDDGPSLASPGSINRVFPIRSAVSIDPAATPMPQSETSAGFPGFASASNRRSSRASLPGRVPRVDSIRKAESDVSDTDTSDTVRFIDTSSATDVQPPHLLMPRQPYKDDDSVRSDDGSSVSGGVPLSNPKDVQLVTARFKHVVTDSGHAVITGRDGETLQRCEDEPIHIPGAVQSFGSLIALRDEDDKLVVRVASENSARIIGYAPDQLFKLSSFLDIFTEEQADNLMDHYDFIRDQEPRDVEANGPEVFMVSLRPPGSRVRKLWCAMHLTESDPSLIICEFEIEDDKLNPLISQLDAMTPEIPEDTLSSNPTTEEFIDSTVNISKPLRVLRSARKKRTEAAAMEVFNIMSQVQDQLSNAPTLSVFLKVLIGIVKELTGFHRVMIYQFDQAWNGRVVAELVDPRATTDLYKGLNFPASDIPKQARDLYKINKVRVLYDRDLETSRLVCRTMEDLEKPLDMTHANLRAMSPIHLKYLANMAVRSSMSISINGFGELWGLIACHSYGPRGMRVSFPIRKMCRLVGDTASRNIERLSYASRLQARKLINTTSSTTNPSGYIVASSEDLLKLFSAEVGALSIRGETKMMGHPRGHLPEILAMVEYLRMRKMSSVFSSQDIMTDFPDLRYDPGLKYVAGVLFVPLSTGGNDFIAFFRSGVLQEVKWAGNPYDKFIKEGTEGYLEPRTSFKAWTETIVGRCRDWTDDEIETAAVLCLVYGKFIDVWRQKETALQTSQLTRLLLANSAHEVRTPLNAIINYLEIAMEGALDNETRENLAKSHSASKSLVYVINDLLDLTKAEGGQTLVKSESFDLLNTLKEATDPFFGDAKRKNLTYQVNIAPDLPQHVIGDHRRVRQVVSNLIANAFQHTLVGSVSVGAKISDSPRIQGKTEIEVAVEDTGKGMPQEKIDALFRELEEVSYEEDLPQQKAVTSDAFSSEKEDEPSHLGLGLAVVARTIRHMNGQLRVKTEEGKGSTFTMLLTFDVSGSDQKQLTKDPTTAEGRNQEISPTSSGEVTLIYRTTKGRPGQAPPIARRASAESSHSLGSLKSGKSTTSILSETSQKSDADRLIDAIQEPLRFSEEKSGGVPDGKTIKKRTSVGSGSSTPTLPLSGEMSSPSATKTPVTSPRSRQSAFQKLPGQTPISDSGMPLRPVRVPDQSLEQSESGKKGPRVAFSHEPDLMSPLSDMADKDRFISGDKFSILVAEDDPINSRIMKKRLEKLGHAAYMTVNGEECSSAHGEEPTKFDAILMDLQMPIVDGFSSTKMIRSTEKVRPSSCLSSRAKLNGRIPIFAVSASLVEADRQKYIDTGFDGWILKPVDFKRVDLLLRGIVDDECRRSCVYQNGTWESGGWFSASPGGDKMQQPDTTPSQQKPTLEGEKLQEPGTKAAPDVTATLEDRQTNV
ncbi:hypothetical protein B0A52_09145 [Exophiala mesophila]|uniref:Cyanobacterial phytochrome B n=1 Tax=Exophiala mesophila TaxID=212818 RepID=A0A438MUG1_EXOME|nr:hypothetical protein B0A52_09145 [Exophiala mesophila]